MDFNIEEALASRNRITVDNASDDEVSKDESKSDPKGKFRTRNYELSYPAMIAFGTRIAIDQSSTLLLLNMAYGWMPTSARIHTNNLKPLSAVLKKAQQRQEISEPELVDAADTIRSAVGLSKMLHFVAPDDYAIFDSVIKKNLNNGKGSTYEPSMEKAIKEYLTFNKAVRDFQDKNFIAFPTLRDVEKALFEGKILGD